uniref:Uncharacterized protein n=1 Tax=Arundo donax TaxID=35708 RepID=A0A0A9AYI3_ARUDO
MKVMPRWPARCRTLAASP